MLAAAPSAAPAVEMTHQQGHMLLGPPLQRQQLPRWWRKQRSGPPRLTDRNVLVRPLLQLQQLRQQLQMPFRIHRRAFITPHRSTGGCPSGCKSS